MSGNLSYYALPLQFVLNMACHWSKIAVVSKSGTSWNNVAPRQNEVKAVASLSLKDQQLLARISAAAANGIEFIPLLLAGIVCSNQTHLPVEVINKWIAISMLCRIAFIPFYIFGTTQIVALLRTLSWSGAIGSVMYLIKLSGDKAYSS